VTKRRFDIQVHYADFHLGTKGKTGTNQNSKWMMSANNSIIRRNSLAMTYPTMAPIVIIIIENIFRKSCLIPH